MDLENEASAGTIAAPIARDESWQPCGCILEPAGDARGAGGVLQAVASYTLIGRSAACHLRLAGKHVSTTHACMRWTGDAWRLQDLGSTNGTFCNGRRLTHATQVALRGGDTLSFGGDPTYRVCSAGRPPAAAVPLDGGTPEFESGGLVALPSREVPEAMLFATQAGWVIETRSGRELTADGAVLMVGGVAWRFHCPLVVHPTEALAGSFRGTMADLELTFRVSSDEEHVNVVVGRPRGSQLLPNRACFYLLLTLARARLEDAHSGLPELSAGWIDSAELQSRLRTTEQQINVDIYRLRRLFSDLGIADAANVVERRPRLGQLRVGTALLCVERG